jgi:hypothetical protein
MRGIVFRLQTSVARFWWAVRQIFGDAAYENYLRSVSAENGQGGKAQTPLSPEDFYLDSLRRRYSRISRCC